MPPPMKPPGQRRRRNVASTKTRLPRVGRSGAPPKWPFAKQTKEEAPIWVELWGTPQAMAWELLGYERAVARYVRLLVQVEGIVTNIKLLTEVRHLEDRLGLTPLALLRLQWEIVDDTETAPAADLVVVPDDRWLQVGA